MNSAILCLTSTNFSIKALFWVDVVTVIVTCASTAFGILFATLFTQIQIFIYRVAIAAAVSNSIVSLIILFVVIQQLRGRNFHYENFSASSKKYLVFFCGTLLLLAAAGLNLTTLTWAELYPSEVARTTVSNQIFTLLKVAFCLGGLAVALQLTFVVVILKRHQTSRLREAFNNNEKTDAYLDPLNRTALRTSMSSQSEESQNVSEQRQAFAAVSNNAEEPSCQHGHQRSRLEPIPGSRPDSPAKMLDGPFLAEAEQTDAMEEESPRPNSASSKSSGPSLDENLVAPRFRPKADQSNASSPIVDESHIHPLFRSDSPLPPPTPTIGTTVTASIYGGRVLSPQSLSRASSRSRSQSPGLGVRPAVRSRAVSANSSVVHLQSHVHQNGLRLSRSQSLEAIRSRLLKGAPSETRTPPVPDLPPARACSAAS